jgi:hypothetical protein
MKKFILLIMAAMTAPAYAADSQPIAFLRDAVVYGNTYGNWSAAWRQWADSLPIDNHPLFDTAPCSKGQSGPVWFLGGKFCSDQTGVCQDQTNLIASRSCDIPAGKALYFPIFNMSCLYEEAQSELCVTAGPLVSEIRAVLDDLVNQSKNLQVTWDGMTVNDNYLKENFRVQSPMYLTTVPNNNLYQFGGEAGIVKGQYSAVDDGIYIMLAPPKKGRHTLNIKATTPPLFGGNRYNITYDLIVK